MIVQKRGSFISVSSQSSNGGQGSAKIVAPFKTGRNKSINSKDSSGEARMDDGSNDGGMMKLGDANSSDGGGSNQSMGIPSYP